MTDNHPITPPPELVREWNEAVIGTHFPPYGYSEYIATQGARWGADQELEACCGLIGSAYVRDQVRAARRPKPPSLAEEALEAFMQLPLKVWGERDTGPVLLKIRRALKRLQELEGGK